MEATTFITTCLRDLHGGLKAELEPLTQDQLVAIPAKGANTVAFLLWHFVRSEDQILLGQAAGRETLWKANNWAARLGPLEGMGTGYTEEQVAAFRPTKEDLLEYSQQVFEESANVVASLSAADLDRAPNPERPQMTLGRSIANFVVGHGFWHLGDIRYSKGLMGMPFVR